MRGDAAYLGRTGVAVVGARNASASGRRLAETLSTKLASDPAITIVSGLARGIDTAAHAGALAGDGSTVAVMAGGVDVVYPPENAGLYKKSSNTVRSSTPMCRAMRCATAWFHVCRPSPLRLTKSCGGAN